MNFWRQLKKLFAEEQPEGAQGCGSATEPQTRHEVLQRSKAERQAFQAWMQAEGYRHFSTWLEQRYADFQQQKLLGQDPICFLLIPSVNGFVIDYSPERWEADDFVHFFDFLKHRVMELGYHPQTADQRHTRCGSVMESIHRYYLKPPRPTQYIPGEPNEQHYGNIMICLTLHNERLVNLKFSATHYNDRAYLPARPFAELMQHICQ